MTTTTTAAIAATATPPAAPTTSAPPNQPLSSASAALKSLRLPANYGATLGVKKLLTLVPVGKPKKPQFFRTHAAPEMTFAAMLLEQKESRESYVVMPDVAQEISELVRPVQLHAAIDRQNNVFLIPVPLPGEDGTRTPGMSRWRRPWSTPNSSGCASPPTCTWAATTFTKPKGRCPSPNGPRMTSTC